jgi:hypothetical protein
MRGRVTRVEHDIEERGWSPKSNTVIQHVSVYLSAEAAKEKTDE